MILRILLAIFVFANLPVPVFGQALPDNTRLPESQISQSSEQISRNLRCGINSLYLALNYLTGESGVELYHELGMQFPNIERDGTTLAHIQRCLEQEGLVCRFVVLDKKIVENMKLPAVAFLLQEGKDISHVVLLKRKNVNDFRLIDSALVNSPNAPKPLTLDDAKMLKNLALFVAKNAEDLPPRETFFSKHGLSSALAVCGVALLLVALFGVIKDARNKKKKQSTPAPE